jgi:FlaA1/EpsC-like NDP-sugar epimerase
VAPAVDCVCWALALFTATALRLDLGSHSTLVFSRLADAVGTAVAAQLVIGAALLYWRLWRVGSFEEVVTVSEVVLVTGMLVLVLALITGYPDIPHSAIAAATAYTLVLSVGTRATWRHLRQLRIPASETASGAIVFGAGEGGKQIIDALATTPGCAYRAVALIDDDPAKRSLQLRHLRVAGGRSQLTRLAHATNATGLIIAIPSASSELIRDLTGPAEALGLEVMALPPVSRLFAGEVGLADIRPVTTADLLGRHAIDTELDAIAGYLTGRRVLVTGAGGSIGSELCRQIDQFAPASLVMLDRDESALHHVQLVAEGRAMLDSRRLVICDIRDAPALEAVFDEHRPEVVFHAAALKHLPLLEMWPVEAFKTNVLGTLNVLEVSAAIGVDRFVDISTDKAANPCSVLGYSKRLAERLTAAIGERGSGEYLSVRFGNVLGSRGSVLPAFRTQIEAGGPVTVTHPDATRYFMMVEEAVQLVVQAGAVGRTGEVLVLDMGSPVRITDVAERLVAESPRPIRIVFTGLRQGEKLTEDLFGPEEIVVRSAHPRISAAVVPPVDPDVVRRLERALAARTTAERAAEVKEILGRACASQADGLSGATVVSASRGSW